MITDLDKLAGKLAGAIYSDIANQFPIPALMLVPGLTFKVRKRLEEAMTLPHFTKKEKAELANDIQIAIVPMLYTFEIDPASIEKMAPVIEKAALKILDQSI